MILPMTYNYNSAKLVIVVSTLVMIFVSAPRGHAQVLPGLLNIFEIQYSALLSCTPTGNPPSTGGGVPGVVGAILNSMCNGASVDGGMALTNATGFAQGTLTVTEGIAIDPAGKNRCFLRVKLPVTGINCTVLPPTGLLQSVFQLVSVFTNPAGRLVAVVTAGPWFNVL